ncbi:uncharacterized protein LOC127144415 [Cucumis melo]|uniref:Uncharacterized protein LOC127144415 n=1 Tax=Cucumis melo TaxID=3656 RepID=A0ABM3KER6_CUCME|nr:uncharacterized protein LOC127144415 [Cucumis melo]
MRCVEYVYSNIRDYLSSVGFEKWSRAYSRRRRYRMMKSNSAESLNSVFKDLRELPVATMLCLIRDVLQKWFYERSKAASTMKSHLTSWAENILHLEHEKSRRLLVDPISTTEYQVTNGNQQFIVKLNVGCCSCRVWDVEEIPCTHALAVLRMLNLDTYSYLSEFYYRETLSATYYGCIQLIGSHFDERVVDSVTKILPPVFKRQAGRPRKQRIPYVDEFSSSARCSNCNRKGYNSRTCK